MCDCSCCHLAPSVPPPSTQVSDLKVVVDRKDKPVAPVLKAEKGETGDRGETGPRGPAGLDVSASTRRLGHVWKTRKSQSLLPLLLCTRALEEFQETEDPKVIKGSGGPLGPPDPLVERLSSEGPRDLRGLLESQESQEYQESLGELGNWGKWGDPARR